MTLPKTTEYLADLVIQNYQAFNLYVINRANGETLSSVAHQVVDMLEWEQMFNEPKIQFELELTGPNPRDLMEEFYISNGYFSSENEEDFDGIIHLSAYYDIPKHYETELFEIFVKENLEKQTRRCPTYMFEKMPPKFLDIMFEENYIEKNYSITELAKLYETTKNEKFLPKEARDIFIF